MSAHMQRGGGTGEGARPLGGKVIIKPVPDDVLPSGAPAPAPVPVPVRADTALGDDNKRADSGAPPAPDTGLVRGKGVDGMVETTVGRLPRLTDCANPPRGVLTTLVPSTGPGTGTPRGVASVAGTMVTVAAGEEEEEEDVPWAPAPAPAAGNPRGVAAGVSTIVDSARSTRGLGKGVLPIGRHSAAPVSRTVLGGDASDELVLTTATDALSTGKVTTGDSNTRIPAAGPVTAALPSNRCRYSPSKAAKFLAARLDCRGHNGQETQVVADGAAAALWLRAPTQVAHTVW